MRGGIAGLLLTCLVCHPAYSRLLRHREAAEEEQLRVLQLNAWLDGTAVPNGIEKIVEIIHASKANVVAFSEVKLKDLPGPFDFLSQVVDGLKHRGLKFTGKHVGSGGDVAVISQWEISGEDLVFNEMSLSHHNGGLVNHGSVMLCRLKSPHSGIQVVFASAHLDWQSYSLYLPRGYQASSPFGKLPSQNTNLKDIEETERASRRLAALNTFVNYVDADDELKRLPTILSGDFNTASHLDWTDATKSLQDHHGVVYAFPCSKFLEKQGFLDAWRKIYPDPVRNPGTTWPSETTLKASTSWAKMADERDRIDYIYYRYSPPYEMDLSEVALVGSRNYYAYDKLVTSNGDDPFLLEDKEWPSDHKAVVADFRISHRAA